MAFPEHIWRVPTREAIEAVATRFQLPVDPSMQDWEYQVADPKRLNEFLSAYETGQLSNDEKFVLMQMILESFEELARRGNNIGADARWQHTLALLDKNILLHGYSIWYWSRPDAEKDDELFFVSPFIRQILSAHRAYFHSSIMK